MRAIVFNGVVKYKPGGLTKIDASALNQVTLGANSVVALVGEADGGAPGGSVGVQVVPAPQDAADIFTSGPLADGARQAFSSSSSPLVPAGASQVLCWKTNNSTVANETFPASNATVVQSGIVSGVGSSTTLVHAGIVGDFFDDQFNGNKIVLRPGTATTEIRTITDYVDSTGTFTVTPAWTVDPGAAEVYDVLRDEVEILDQSASNTTTTVTLTDNTSMVVDTHAGRWVLMQDAGNLAEFLRKIASNTADTLTFSPPVPGAFAAGAIIQVLPNALDVVSELWGLNANNISVDIDDGVTSGTSIISTFFEGKQISSPELGGLPFLKVLYQGAGAAITTAVDDGTGTITASTIPCTAAAFSGVDSERGNQVLINGEFTTVVSNTVDVLTVSPPLSAIPANTDVVVVTALGSLSFAQINGASGVATSISFTLAGVVDVNTVTITAAMTLNQLVDAINANTNYLATVPAGINGDVVLAKDFDFGPSATTSVINSAALTSAGLVQDAVNMANFLFDGSQLVNGTRSTDSSKAGRTAPMPTDAFVALTGGTRGVSTNSDFQAGLDALLTVRANSIVPLISADLVNDGFGSTATFASVAAQLVSHVTLARGAVSSERGGFIGRSGTRTQIIDQAALLGDFDVQLCAQKPTVTNVAGSLQEFPEWMQAVIGASMRAGVIEVAEPLTNKPLRVFGLTQDQSWDPSDVGDQNALLAGGVFFAETAEGSTRWVRDLTTYILDDNLAFTDGNVRDAVRFTAFELRTTLVRRFIGRKATPATINSIKDTATDVLNLLSQDDIIVDSTDLNTGEVIRAFHNLKVTSSGDTVNLVVGIFPVPGINFILNTIFLQLATQAA